MESNRTSLVINTFAYVTDQLIDLHSLNLKTTKHKINAQTIYIYTDKYNKLYKLSEKFDIAIQSQLICQINIMEETNEYHLIPLNNNEIWQLLFTTSKSNLENMHKFLITNGDIFRFGKLQYEVISAFKLINKETSITQTQDSNDEQSKCRVCYESDNDEMGKLIKPCKNCKGSMKYIHEGCLSMWLKNKITEIKSEYVTKYRWSSFICDICKNKLDIISNPINLTQIKYNHLILKKINEPKKTKELNSKNQILDYEEIIILNFDTKTELTIGRGNVDVDLEETTVSRDHGSILYENGQYIIKSKITRFGTYKALHKETVINKSDLWFQYNDGLFKLIFNN